MPIDPLTIAGAGRALKQASTAGAAASGDAATGGFSHTLSSLIDGVEQAESEANTAVTGMLDKTTDVHDAMIALQRADLTMQFSVQIRNKLVQAYQEIMRMPV